MPICAIDANLPKKSSGKIVLHFINEADLTTTSCGVRFAVHSKSRTFSFLKMMADLRDFGSRKVFVNARPGSVNLVMTRTSIR
jgi:hypothetical protein